MVLRIVVAAGERLAYRVLMQLTHNILTRPPLCFVVGFIGFTDGFIALLDNIYNILYMSWVISTLVDFTKLLN